MATSSLRVVARVAAGLSLAGLAAAAEAQLAPIYVIPTESRATQAVADGAPLPVELHGRDLAALARSLGVPAPPAGAAYLAYTAADYPQAVTRVERSWLEPSFVIDFDEPAVAAMHASFVAAGSGEGVRERLVRFVADAVEEQEGRGWDVASRVAANRVGDCTEHAVLLTALARRSGVPARVVMGVAIVNVGGRYASYGHAWSELREDGRWVVADAALSGLGSPVHYLPLGLLEQEGPGFFMSVAAFMQGWVQRVVVLGAEPRAQPG